MSMNGPSENFRTHSASVLRNEQQQQQLQQQLEQLQQLQQHQQQQQQLSGPSHPLLHGIMTPHESSPADRSINVVIRVRPLLDRNPPQNDASTGNSSVKSARSRSQSSGSVQANATSITFPAAGQIEVEDNIANTTRSFAFNVVFEPEATQEEVFEHSGVKRLTDMALDGFACTVFAYGQTSTGKTYTLTGNLYQAAQDRVDNATMGARRSHQSVKGARDSASFSRSFDSSASQRSSSDSPASHLPPQSPPPGVPPSSTKQRPKKRLGIIQMAFAYLFEQIKRRKIRDKVLYVITVSYLEVYNEQVYDLLNPSAKPLQVRWSKERGFYGENLFKIECEDIGDLEGVLEEGCKNRQVRSHSMNENSSRSHAVMTINLASEMPDPEDPQGFIRKEGRFCLVDLAGSEKTKRTNSKGGTFIEANNINRSLLVLGNCIACLADGKRRTGHIPYRDSTLTKLLADSLAGNGMTLMVACVSPLKNDAQETINTLRYASRAKRVKMNPVIQMDPRELLILSLKREVRLLRVENSFLRQQQQPSHTFDNVNVDARQIGLAMGDDHENSNSRSSVSPTAAPSSTHRSRSNSIASHPMFVKYMHENEVLRVENVELNLQHNRLIRDHELVCRENERLLKKLHGLLSRLDSSAEHKASIVGGAIPLPVMPSLLSSSASSPSLLSLNDEVDEIRNVRSNLQQQLQQQQQSRNQTTAQVNGDSRVRSTQQSHRSRAGSKSIERRAPNSSHHNDSELTPPAAATLASTALDLTIRGLSARRHHQPVSTTNSSALPRSKRS